MNPTEPAEARREARRFLEGFGRFLNVQPTSKFPNEASFNDFVACKLKEYLSSDQLKTHLREAWLKPADAYQAVLSESYRRLNGVASSSPASTEPHPFSKKLGSDAATIWKKWQAQSRKSPLVQSCPDMALREPFKYRIVIEGKYFRGKNLAAGGSALVTGIYELFFYRGLPEVPPKRNRAAWKYDYGCLVAFDSTGYLTDAWEEVSSRIGDALWNSARVHLLLVRPH